MDLAGLDRRSFATRVNELSGQPTHLCYHCRKCTAGCPAATSMEFGPDRLLRIIQLGQWERALTSRDAWLCLGCEMCGAHCPNEIDMYEVMIALKEIASEAGYRVDDCQSLRDLLADYLLRRPAVVDDRLCVGFQRLNRLQETIGTARNVSGDDNDNRLIWSQNMERQMAGLDARQGAEVVYFVGCVASFFPGSYSVPQAMASILHGCGANFTTLGGQEWCCGYPLLLMGQLDEARGLIEHNIAQVRRLGASRVVFACPSCYHMWKLVYPKVLAADVESGVEGATSLAGLEILHSTELVGELMSGDSVRLGEMALRVTYHDPCDLGRKSHVFEPPRRLLASIPGVEFVEMSSAGQISECCGGGGNLESFEPAVTDEVSLRRVERALEVGAQVIASACQQCERTLTRAIRRHPEARRARMRVMDVTQLVWSAVESGADAVAS